MRQESNPDEKFPRHIHKNGVESRNSMTALLTDLLRQRIAIIADHAWRDEDSAAHLEALKQVSEKISAWTVAHRSEVDAQLRHYLANASYQKALAHLEANTNEPSPH